ncbi:MAG: H(+)-transporting V1 sector ATPase subunit H [Phylliscum demangeonii]|nr:MAG: H(+)-transporting V1 sector ATPase subunit H [Phylliscum demangeonii]
MSTDPPAYLLSLQANIRARPIPWDGAVRAGHLTEGQLKKIKSVDKVRKEQRRRTVEEDLPAFRTLLLGDPGDGGDAAVLDTARKRVDVVQYILVLMGDLLDDVPPLAPALLEHPSPYDAFLPFLRASRTTGGGSKSTLVEDPIPLLASAVLCRLLSAALTAPATTNAAPTASSAAATSTNRPALEEEVGKALPKLYSYLSLLSRSSDSGLQDIAVQQYSALLRNGQSRRIFLRQRDETVAPLVETLRAAAGLEKSGSDYGEDAATVWSGAAAAPASSTVRSAGDSGGGGVGLQLLYHVLLVLWQLSFEGVWVGDELEEAYEIIPLYAQLLRFSPKEKTTRVLLSTLRNLLSSSSSNSSSTDPSSLSSSSSSTLLLPAATLARLPSALQSIRSRHLTDPDLLDDLQALTTLMDDYCRTQTTFDEYAAEVRSEHLHWSPPHRNESFWRENARRIVDDLHGELLLLLAAILAKPWEGNKTVLAVACNDVAWLVKVLPQQPLRDRLEKLGLKARVMALMADEDQAVRWESLRAVGEWLRYSFSA